MSRADRVRYETAPGAPARRASGRCAADAAVHDSVASLTHVRLWENPLWLSARLNILANRFNVPMYGWIEERFGLGRPEFVVLYQLSLVDNLSAATISVSTAFPKNTLSRAVQRLLRLKMIARRSDPADGRSYLLTLSARGRAVVDEATPRLYACEQAMLAGLSMRDRETLSALLAKMVEALESDVP